MVSWLISQIVRQNTFLNNDPLKLCENDVVGDVSFPVKFVIPKLFRIAFESDA